ncbi:hypothetical protein [Krasilnikovia sp. M28-CT-15]|uniref:hypothetical protein n=1 Tax=Krasilnikovia sp. M28-CT-15 TaxID=3373540 RepID=UPI003876A530
MSDTERPWTDYVVPAAVLAAGLGLLLLMRWITPPEPPPVPYRFVERGVLGQTRWSVLVADPDGRPCLQVRVDGAERALMCDRDWDLPPGPATMLWSSGETPRPTNLRPPPLLQVDGVGSDRVLVASVLPDTITEVRLSATGGPDETLTPRRLDPDRQLTFVAAVVARDQLAGPQAFDRTGQTIWYQRR